MNDKVLQILCEVRPEINFADSRNFTADGLLDSFDMIMLIAELELAFGVKILPVSPRFRLLSNVLYRLHEAAVSR